MSKFVYEANTYTLKFGPNDQLAGLEVVVQSVPLGRFLKIMELSSLASDKDPSKAVTALSELFTGFAKALTSWNLTAPDGQDVPSTREALDELPTELVMRLIQEWMQAIGGVSPELGKDSDSGVTYPAVPMPMAAA